jgi:hypothetical protein
MIIKIKEPNGSVSSTIPLSDIDHVETHTLSFFDEKVYSLYLVLKREGQSYFHLFSYKCPANMLKAEKQITTLLQNKQPGYAYSSEEALELFPSAEPAGGKETHLAN